jgi:hypothetical protein
MYLFTNSNVRKIGQFLLSFKLISN